ncbi:hypothetical protein LUZ60_009758 [Juncus effusus]|nr:hypothetical protein LUZ60_009758 [Juncus effusus]
MALCNPFLNFSEQLGYVQCSFCSTILLVSVPCCSSLLKMVTVRCGHCTGLLSVSLAPPSNPFLPPLQSPSPLSSSNHEENEDNCIDMLPKTCEKKGDQQQEDQEEESTMIVSLVNKPPEKRQRAPSAYNHFIKEEIKRIKATEPNISHKEAFSTAAKNWAQFPRMQYKGKGN